MANEKQKEFRFTEKMISRIRDYVGDDPNKSIDRVTHEHKKIAEVNVPSKAFRNYNFGFDEEGRNLDTYTAYINVPTSVIGLNLKGVQRSEAKNYMLYGDKEHFFDKRGGDNKVRDDFEITNLYMYADTKREYKIHFRPKVLENGDYDQPKSITVTGSDLAEMYRDMFNKELNIAPQETEQPAPELNSAKELKEAKKEKAKAGSRKTKATKAKAEKQPAKEKPKAVAKKKTVDRTSR